MSDTDGHFRIGVEPGDYAFTVNFSGMGEGFLGKLKAVPGDTLSGLQLRMGRLGSRVSGQLVDEDGNLVGDGRITFARISNEEGDVFLAHVDQGRFEISLRPGTYFQFAVAPGRRAMPGRIELRADLPGRRIELAHTLSPAGQEVKAWIKAHALRVHAGGAGQGFEDLEPLQQMVGGARVVSMGEVTHGTREFFLMKHRMLEFLVEKMGFTVFAMEANMPEARKSLGLNTEIASN